jgi:hypothetical protein
MDELRQQGDQSLTLLHPPSLSDLGRETGLDSSYASPGTARVAGNEVETVLSLVELRIRRTACLASDIFNATKCQLRQEF